MVDAPIGRSIREPTRMVVSATGKEARTRYEVKQTFIEPSPVALVECQLETGRTHQIRVHMSAIGHPVVGDERYRGVRQTISSPRMVLHSAAISFDHPTRTDDRPTPLTVQSGPRFAAQVGVTTGAGSPSPGHAAFP
jgi:23S rRNA pseudouridine1911/1915/1917 synthase